MLLAREMGVHLLMAKNDSFLSRSSCQVKDPHLARYLWCVGYLLEEFDSFEIMHVLGNKIHGLTCWRSWPIRPNHDTFSQ